jgi:hypothetical protein
MIGFAFGGLVMLGPASCTTAPPLARPARGYQASGPRPVVGFGGQHTFLAGMANEQSQLAFLLLVLNGWPLYAGLAFLLLPLVL